MPATIRTIEMIETPDEDPDPSYLMQEGFEDRLAAYRRDDFSFVGIQAQAEILIPYGSGHIIQTITSPGLWGIESDSGDDYFRSVFKDEGDVLRSMLDELGVINWAKDDA